MSGLSRTPGKRVWVNSPPRVRIPPSPPEQGSHCKILIFNGFLYFFIYHSSEIFSYAAALSVR